MIGVSFDTRDGDSPSPFAGWLRMAALGILCACLVGAPGLGLFRSRIFAESESFSRGEERLEREAPEAPEVEPKDEPLFAVVIEGNTTIPNDQIAKHIKTRAGRPVTPKQVKDDVRALHATRWFFSVESRFRRTEDGLVLVYKVLERPILQRVEYKGNKKIKTKDLAALTNLKPGGAYDQNVNREAARRIESHYHEKSFVYAKVELEKGDSKEDRDVVFKITEGPKVHVSSIKIEGNKEFSDGILKTKLKTKTRILWLFGGKYDPATIPEDIVALKEYYHSLGYFNVKISPHVKASSASPKVEIDYTVEEGKRFKVRNIEYVGNGVISEPSLRKDSKLKENQYFNERYMTGDVEKVTKQYGELGRIFAKVQAVPRFEENSEMMDIVYNIDEDEPYRIRRINVHIDGEHPHTKESVLLTRILTKSGDLADGSKIKKSEQRLAGSGILGQQQPGSPDAPKITISKVEPELPSLDLDSGTRRRVFRGQNPATGPDAAPAGRTVRQSRAVRGTGAPQKSNALQNSSSADGDDALPAKSILDGSPLGDEGLVRGQDPQSLDPLRPENPIFQNTPQGGPLTDALNGPPPNFVDLNINAAEGQTGRLMFGVGVNSNAGVVGSAVLDESNFDITRIPTSWQDVTDGTAFRGGGQQFRLEAVPGTQVSRYSASWRDPYFMDQNFSLGVSGSYYTRFFPDWYETRGGGRVTVGQQFTPYFSGSMALRAENVNLTNPSVPFEPLLAQSLGNNFLSTFRVSFAHDTRDRAFLPGSGHYIEAGYEQAFGNFDYPRGDVEGRQYFTVRERPDGGGRHIVTLNGQLGFTGSSTPIFERYFAGGFQSFRGFAFRGVTPRDLGVGIGGQFLALGTAEYMFPVMADSTIQVVTFTDFGTVANNVSFADFRLTVGAGIRVTIPAMGPAPIAIDFGIPIIKDDSDRTQLVAFYVGMLR